jgi:hypothetical protein
MVSHVAIAAVGHSRARMGEIPKKIAQSLDYHHYSL